MAATSATMSLSQAARLMHGCLAGRDCTFHGVSTDTRTLAAGELFFALSGERHDGARFVSAAFDGGAAGAVVTHDALPAGAGGPLIRVDDTRLALGRLAGGWRARFAARMVALTGSNGKTTVKEMIASVLRRAAEGDDARVLATAGNLNNDIGVPLTLLRLSQAHRFAVVEMGMNHAGEIRYLTQLARPDVALVTNAGRAHIGMLGTVDAIARAKGEIYEALGAQGTAVINADDAFAPLWRAMSGERRVIDFAVSAPAQVRARYHDRGLSSEIELRAPAGDVSFVLPAPGAHNVHNALAAAAAAIAMSVPLATIADGLARFEGVAGRLQRKAGLHGAVLIDDTYNANPDSVLAAIAVLGAARGTRILVLGDMGELGAASAQLHAQMGTAAREAGIDRLITFGELSREAASAFGPGARHHTRIEDLLADIELALDATTTVLVKGSRFMQMERIVRAFQRADAVAHGTGA